MGPWAKLMGEGDMASKPESIEEKSENCMR